MIKLENHSKIEYSVAEELIDNAIKSTIEMNAEIKTANDVLEVGNEFQLLGLNYVLVKSVRNDIKVYYKFQTQEKGAF